MRVTPFTRLSQSLRAGWKKGDEVIKKPFTYQSICADVLTTGEVYKLMTSCIVPRPIAMVVTRDLSGNCNLAPFSYFTGVSSDPPMLLFSVTAAPSGGEKHTLENVRQNGEFSVNVSSEWMAEGVTESSREYPKEVDEALIMGYGHIDSVHIQTPRLAQAAIQMECTVDQIIAIGEGKGMGNLILGKIEMFHISEHLYTNNKIDMEKLAPIARLGGFEYAPINQVYTRSLKDVCS